MFHPRRFASWRAAPSATAAALTPRPSVDAVVGALLAVSHGSILRSQIFYNFRPGLSYAGWRYATIHEVKDILSRVGFVDIGSGVYSPANFQPAKKLLGIAGQWQFLGSSYGQTSEHVLAGFVDDFGSFPVYERTSNTKAKWLSADAVRLHGPPMRTVVEVRLRTDVEEGLSLLRQIPTTSRSYGSFLVRRARDLFQDPGPFYSRINGESTCGNV